MLLSNRNLIRIVLFWLVLIDKAILAICLHDNSFLNCYSSIFFNLFIKCFTLSKYVAITRFAVVKLPLTLFTIGVESLQIMIIFSLNYITSLSPWIKALYSASLLEALNLNLKKCWILFHYMSHSCTNSMIWLTWLCIFWVLLLRDCKFWYKFG